MKEDLPRGLTHPGAASASWAAGIRELGQSGGLRRSEAELFLQEPLGMSQAAQPEDKGADANEN